MIASFAVKLLEIPESTPQTSNSRFRKLLRLQEWRVAEFFDSFPKFLFVANQFFLCGTNMKSKFNFREDELWTFITSQSKRCYLQAVKFSEEEKNVREAIPQSDTKSGNFY